MLIFLLISLASSTDIDIPLNDPSVNQTIQQIASIEHQNLNSTEEPLEEIPDPIVLIPPSAPKTFNITEARQLFDLTAGAYGDEHCANLCIRKSYGTEHTRKVVLSLSHQCDPFQSICSSYIVVADDQKEIIVIARGTQGLRQLFIEGLHALKAPVKFLEMGMVNSYFFSAHDYAWPEVKKVLEDESTKNYSVIFTGHSLGGAIASLSAARAVKEGLRSGDDVKVVTFGQPRVGNTEYARNFNQMIKKSYRIVHRFDIVPHLPTCMTVNNHTAAPCDGNYTMSYYHHGTEIWFPKQNMTVDSEFLECIGDPFGEDHTCSNQFQFKTSRIREYVADHVRYFNRRVSRYGRTGCTGEFNMWTNLQDAISEISDRVFSSLTSITSLFAKEDGVDPRLSEID